uniref:Uncharacterized protein n=1 Tax=Panagrolaimus sp. PS1159 TaxID=55785 RepID=A0AC35G8A5_9BILA
MAKINKKIKKKSKKRRVIKEHDKNCVKCIKYSCLTEAVIAEDQEKRSQKEDLKDPDFKMYASISGKNVNSVENERIASLRPRRSLPNYEEIKKEPKPAESTPILKPIITSQLSTFLTSKKPTGITKLQFLKPKFPINFSYVPSIKAEPAAIIPTTFFEELPSTDIFLTPPPPASTLNESSTVFLGSFFSPTLQRPASPINKYSYLIKNLKDEKI